MISYAPGTLKLEIMQCAIHVTVFEELSKVSDDIEYAGMGS